MKFGGLNHLSANPRDMAGFVKTLQQIPFTAITGVNTLFNGLLNTPGFDQIDFSSMHLSLGGGMAVRSEEHTPELPSLMRTSYAGFCLQKQKYTEQAEHRHQITELKRNVYV